MIRSCRVAVADDDPLVLAELTACVGRGRHRVVIQATSSTELALQCRGAALDLIIIGARTPALTELDAAQEIAEQHDVPVIALSQEFDPQAAESSCGGRVFAHLMKPIREAELLAAIPLVIQRFQELRAAREECISMQRTLEERKLVERAKGVIMRRQSLDEASAFRYLQHMARNHRLKMGELARSIILAHEALTFPAVPAPHVLSSVRHSASGGKNG